jgi:apolipoprotein N-acyltransferase
VIAEQAGAPAALSVALVQGNIPQEIRVRQTEADAILAKHVRLSLEAKNRVDLVAWPESTASYVLDREPDLVALLAELSSQVGAPILVGATASNAAPAPPSNAAYFITPRGIEGRSDKRVLVPGAETLLLLDHVPALRDPIGAYLSRTMHFRPYMTAGRDARPFTLITRARGAVTVGSLICYDDNVPLPSEELHAVGADALIVMSNEAWFGSRELDQHLAMAALRCIETRLPMGRATNTGRTCIIDPCGRITQILDANSDGMIIGDLASSTRPAVPGWWREILALIVTAGMLGLTAWSLWRAR